MKKSYNVEAAFNGMRLDRWIRNKIGNAQMFQDRILVLNLERKMKPEF